MTLIIVLIAKDGIVMGADGRGSYQYGEGDQKELIAISKSEIKLYKLSDYVGIGIFGSANIGIELINMLKKKINTSNKYFTSIFSSTRNFLMSEYSSWFPANSSFEKWPEFGLIIAGLEEDTYEAKIYCILSNKFFAKEPCLNGFATVGEPRYAQYLAKRLYNSDMSIKSLSKLAAYLLIETTEMMPNIVGGQMKIVEISKDDGFCELNTDEISILSKNCSEYNDKILEYFYKD